MANSKIPNTVKAFLLTLLCTTSAIKCDNYQQYQHRQSTFQDDSAPYPQPWDQPISESSSSSSSSSSLHSSMPNHAISSSTYYHSPSSSRAGEIPSNEPVLCLLRGISIEQTRNQSRNFYECPGRWPAEFIECCEDNHCCAPNYVRQYLQEKVSEFEKLIVIFCLSFLFVFILYLLCFFIPCCPLKSLCRAKKNRDYAGCTTKMTTEGPQYQTMAQEQCPSLAMGNVGNGGSGGHSNPTLLSQRGGVAMSLPPTHPSGNRVAISETTLILEGSGSCLDEPSSASSSSNSGTGSGSNGGSCNGSHIVTIHHANSSRGSSPTTDSSLLSLVHGNTATINGGNSGRMISSTFSRPPVKSILKLNHSTGSSNNSSFYSGNGVGSGNAMQMYFANGQTAPVAPATIKPFGYRDPRNSIVSCNPSLLDNGSSGGIVAETRCPVWPDHQQQML